MAVFWNDLDDALVTIFAAQMGTAGAYTSMKAQTINTRIFANQHEWPYWTLPAISVGCHAVRYAPDGHDGGTTRRYARGYQCIAVGLISGTAGTITSAIKEFYERMELVLRGQLITVNSAGVITRGMATIAQGYIDEQMYANDSVDSTKRIGVADFRFEIGAKG